MAEESILLGGIETLRTIGFFDFFLPFILFFAIIYGALDKTKVFGEDRKDINAIIALVISLIASTTGWVLKGVTGFLPWVGFIALILIAFLMLAAMVAGGDVEALFSNPIVKWGGLAFVVIALILGIYYGLGFNESAIGSSVGSMFSKEDVALIIMGVIGIAAFALIVKGGGSSKSD